MSATIILCMTYVVCRFGGRNGLVLIKFEVSREHTGSSILLGKVRLGSGSLDIDIDYLKFSSHSILRWCRAILRSERVGLF